jgi:hypothetical protein
MAPFLRGGETLTINKEPCSSMHIGDLILYKTRAGQLILHRIVRKKHGRDFSIFQTKGDALLSADDAVDAREVIGKVSEIRRTGPHGEDIYIDMESLPQRSINYFLAITGLYRSKAYFAVRKSYIYSSLRSLVKKALV